MADCIDREALMKRLQESPLVKTYLKRIGGYRIIIDGILDLIRNQPALKVSEIVRCEECIHFSWAANQNVNNECRMGFDKVQWISSDGFCSYGERRSDNGKT